MGAVAQPRLRLAQTARCGCEPSARSGARARRATHFLVCASADGMRRAAQRGRGAVLSTCRRQVTLCAGQGDVGGKSEQEAGQGSFASTFSTRAASAQGFGGFKAFQKYGVGVGLTPASIRQRGDASTQK